MENDKVVVLFVPVRRGMMEQMKAFYGEMLGFIFHGSEFLINNIESIRGQLQYSQVSIDPEKTPIFQFNVANNFPEFCTALRHQGAQFDFLAMTPGGYMAKIFDPSGNSVLIGCDSFETTGNYDLSSWKEYRRY